MTLATTISALLTLIRAYSSGTVFTTANSSFGDWSVLDAPGLASSAIISIGSATISGDQVASVNGASYGSAGNFQELHTLTVTVAYKRGQENGGDGALDTTLVTLVDGLKAHLNMYPRLNAATGVLRALIVATGEPDDILLRQDQLIGTHRAQDITIKVLCETANAWVES